MPKEPSADPIKDGLMHRLLNLTTPDKVDPVIPDEPKPVEEPVVTEEVKKDEPVVETPKPEPRTVKVVRRTEADRVTKADLEKFAAKKDEPTTEVVKPVEKPVEEDLSGLLDEERSEVELARYAEKTDPTKFKGLGAGFSKFFKDNKAKLESMAAEDPDFNPAENADYQAWLRANRPKLTRGERDKLFAQKIKDDTVSELRAQHQAELDEIRRDVKSNRVRPEIDRRASEMETAVLEGLPDEVLAYHKANGNDLNKTATEYSLEVGVVRNAAAGAKKVAAEFLAIQEGIVQFDSAKNPTHKFISDFVLNEADDFAKNGGAALIRDGKTFVTPDNYDASKAKTHWTFTNEDIIERLKVAARKEAISVIAAKEAEAAKLGFTRAKKTAPKETVKETESNAPKATSTKSSGPVKSPETTGENVLHKLLNLKPA